MRVSTFSESGGRPRSNSHSGYWLGGRHVPTAPDVEYGKNIASYDHESGELYTVADTGLIEQTRRGSSGFPVASVFVEDYDRRSDKAHSLLALTEIRTERPDSEHLVSGIYG